MNVRLTKSQQIKVLNSQDLYSIMRSILLRDEKIDRGKEHFWVVGLAANNLLQYVELISLGSSRATVVEPMDIYRWALQKDSKKIILVHNHPNGNLQPSVPDVEVTAHMYQVGELLDLPVVDHLIISEKGFYSFVDGGLMAELAQTKKYLLSSAAQERLKKEAEAIGVKKGRKEGEKVGEAKGLKAGEVKGREAVALAMKAKGITVGVIAEVTGLSVGKVKGLKVPTRAPKRSEGGKAKAGRRK